MKHSTYMNLEIPSNSENESFSRVVIAAFVSRLDPTIEEISDIKTAVSEAVTNAIIHAYEDRVGEIIIHARLEGNRLTVEVTDRGKGIEDLEQARQPLFTSKPELERTGMGFTIMENFMDEMMIKTEPGEGTTVVMVKHIRSKHGLEES